MAKIVSMNSREQADVNSRLAAIVDSSFDAIVSKDLNSVIQTWNLAAERLFGYTAEEAIGQSILILIPEHLRSEETDIITRVRRGERVSSYETIRRRKDGRLVNVSLTVSPITNSAGEIVGASKIARDITTAKESERRIRLLMREVNHRVKNQFAVILAIIRETIKHSISPSEFEGRVSERIMALSRSHDLLVTAEWSGSSLFDVIQEHLKPFGHENQILLSGPLLALLPNAVQNIGMALHELGTNSAKYGALASDVGRVAVNWEVKTNVAGRREFFLNWDETSIPYGNGKSDDRAGFGTTVLKRVAPQGLSGSAILDRSPGHLRWSLVAPFEHVVVSTVAEDEAEARKGPAE
ncbi:PAS domain S-box protein [Mesorhizobium sp. IMUNJ 23232]|uniref:PAS domain S-box protein n=1 Tax=Mesorhizobium sp. IMUNJ 23232 TaxID=3376064 RepID=UPI00378F717D